jgi:isopentenyl phosphate kinase
MDMPDLVLLKLGGSLLTDKRQEATPRLDVIERVAREIAQACAARPGMHLLVGHGSGSFGHFAAHQYGTRAGVRGRADWRGFAQVAVAAQRLNRLVTDALLAAGVPVLSLQPSASARCSDGELIALDTFPIVRALAESLVPVLYGDVALDDVRGGTIVSTEELFDYLTVQLDPTRVLLAGEVEGVYADYDETQPEAGGAVIPEITPANFAALRRSLLGSHGVDVTGGMASKVAKMLKTAQEHPGLVIRIFSAREPGRLAQVLAEPTFATGTRISA